MLPDSARWYLPAVRELERLWTLALVVRPRRPSRSACRITRGSRDDLPEIVAFLRQHGARRQFFPAYSQEDFAPGSPLTLGFRVEDFLMARRDGRLVGVLGLWDRSGFKQTVVKGYGGPLARARPLYDRAARLIGARPLPAPGQRVNCAYASFTCIADDEPEVYRTLLEHARWLAFERGYAYLMVGLCAPDPLLRVARRFQHLPYESRIFTVSYKGEPSLHERLDGRVPYLELAAV